MKIKSILLVVPLLTALSTSANESDFYIGAGLGTGGIDTDIAKDIPIPMTIDSEGTPIFINAGYKLNPYVSFETKLQKHGDISFKSPLAKNEYKWSPKSLSFNANVSYPITEFLSPFVSVGVGYISLDENQDSIDKDTGATFTYGLGLEFTPDFLGPVSFNVAYHAEQFDLESKANNKDYSVTLDTYSVNIKYNF
ncbi:porin family protein [Vibrio parahaemolyticus]|uniref:porin family protein n=1 Tax=Vibrio parahaemolyticus TaxID=670 RepID=UPI00215FFC56|nr:porin family protein [Vibrio parahaemolyticus]EGR5850578.1 porin family protein [Vibrio parahaemolyticus]EJG1886321.1 porin family protein [Vibrio parahaemolyticus]ELA7196358.1 porin family protein [Vibrio parahaemolyticus]EME0859364.1 porin family protein [Vibrio parahaemolyticus]MCS0080155.1 porin family protein [Vibrio parahaemolyticus]